MKQQSYMDLERLLTLVFSNPDNINIEYSNINGKEKLVVNGEELTKEEKEFDDSQIKEKIATYKTKIEKLDDYIFGKVIDEAEEKDFNLCEMNRILELEKLTEEEAIKADFTINSMTNLIQKVIKDEVQNLIDTLEMF